MFGLCLVFVAFFSLLTGGWQVSIEWNRCCACCLSWHRAFSCYQLTCSSWQLEKKRFHTVRFVRFTAWLGCFQLMCFYKYVVLFVCLFVWFLDWDPSTGCEQTAPGWFTLQLWILFSILSKTLETFCCAFWYTLVECVLVQCWSFLQNVFMRKEISFWLHFALRCCNSWSLPV